MGATEILFIFFIYLLLFGAKGIPSMAKVWAKQSVHFGMPHRTFSAKSCLTTDLPGRTFPMLERATNSPNQDQDVSPSNMSDGPLDESGPDPNASVHE